MKKIMIIHHSGSLGGAGVSCYNTANSLMKYYDVVVYVPETPTHFSEFLISKQINVKTYSVPLGSIPYYSGGTPILSPVFIKSIWNIKKYKQDWKELIISESPDMIIANSKTTSWLSSISNELNIKSLCFVRETRKKSILNLYNLIQKYLLEKFTGVIFISEYDRLKENLLKAKTSVVPNYLDIDQYSTTHTKSEICQKHNIPVDKFNILFVGGVARIKGIDVAINSMKYLQKYNVNLIVVGDADFRYRTNKGIFNKVYNLLKKNYEKKIFNTIKRYELFNKIKKVGIQRNMVEMYQMADVLIFPANEPHQARPAFEAGACKVPVIMPDYENTTEYIQDGINGLIFRRKNPKSLAQQIIKLIEQPDLKEKLAIENYNHTINVHVKEMSEKKMLDMINSILGEL
jgi:glycosyltransferase involved in cell wall biosynthesis